MPARCTRQLELQAGELQPGGAAGERDPPHGHQRHRPAASASINHVHPLDTVRTRLQAAPAGAYRARLALRARHSKTGGAARALQGPRLEIAAQGLYKAIMFGVYGAASRALRGGDLGENCSRSDEKPGPAASPAAPTSRCWRPSSWSARTAPGRGAGRRCGAARAASRSSRNSRRAGPSSDTQVLREAAAAGGVYRGLGATLLRDVPGVGRHAAFEAMRRRAVALRGSPKLELAAVHQSNCRGDESTRRP